jgi:hypothetical protein
MGPTVLGAARYERACAEAFYRVLSSTPSLPFTRAGKKILSAIRYSELLDDAAYLRLEVAATQQL